MELKTLEKGCIVSRMRVLMISGDKAILEPGTGAYARTELMRAQLEELKIFVWGRGSKTSAKEILRAAQAGHYDIVTAQDPFWRGFIAWRAAKKSGAKLQLQVHTDFDAQSWTKRMIGTFLLKRADGMRVVSEKIKQSLAPLKLQAPISVLPIFIDIEEVRAAVPADKSAFSQCNKIVLVVSRLEPEKNVAGALKVMKEVLKTFPQAGLLIAGDGSEREKLETLAHTLGIEKSVVFLGYRTDIGSYYKIADVLLLTSYYEGFGAVIVQALAAGCPVVSGDVGIAREAGAIVAAPIDQASAVVRVLQSPRSAELKISMPGAAEYAKLWRKTLNI
jgi:glycosyltransferase involved in cell wall biosynthesis